MKRTDIDNHHQDHASDSWWGILFFEVLFQALFTFLFWVIKGIVGIFTRVD